MHESVMAFVEATLLGVDDISDVLEVGSYNVNGSVRTLIEPRAKSYIGVDRYAGPGVDELADAEALPFDAHRFDLVVSTEMLEHADRPWIAVAEMFRVLVHGGRVIVTARGFNEYGAFPFHNPPDRWRMSRDAMYLMFDDASFIDIVVSADPQVPGWFVTAAKPY